VLQLKEMMQRLPEGHNADSSTYSYVETSNRIVDQPLDESHITNIITAKNESGSDAESTVFPNGATTQSEKAEFVVQDEPGVYVSLSSLPGGGNELKRVRFRYLSLATL
jgi:hypothetical protein